MRNANYESVVELPSRGVLYKTIPAEVTIRGMTTREEKMLYASSGNTFQKIIASCIVEPENVDVKELIAADEIFLIIQIRKITFGNEYRVTGICPHCGARDVYTINLDDFIVNYLPEDFKEPIEIKLPKSGDVLGVAILRSRDTEYIERQSKKLSKQFNIPQREIEYTMRMARYFRTINDKEVDIEDARKYVDNMFSMDTAYFWSVLNKILVGYDTTCSVTCSSCQEEFDFTMPVTGEFFRPKFE